jgi:hypothetical protein
MPISPAEYQRRLKAVANITVLRELVNEEFTKDEGTLLELKKQDYLEGDIYGNGTDVAYRSTNYEIFKSKLNPKAGGAVDLILTGDFISSFFLLKGRAGKYLFGAKDKKRNQLVNKYGIDIMGLNKQVFEKYQKEITAPRFIRRLKNYAKIR